MSQTVNYTTALNLMNNGHYAQAAMQLKSLIASGEPSVRLYMALGDCARKLGDLSETARWYEAAVNDDPGNFAAQSNYGLVLKLLKSYDTAKIHCRRAITLNPKNIHAHANLGSIMLETSNYAEAVICFNNVLAIDKTEMVHHSSLIRALLQCGKPSEIADAVEKMIAQFSGSARCYNELGILYSDNGDTSIAKDYYVLALKAEPDNAQAHFNLGTIMRQWSKLDEALICFKNSLKYKPGNVVALVNVGEVYQIMGEHQLALKFFNDALTIDPRCTIAHDNILVSMNYSPDFDTAALHDAHMRWGSTFEAGILPCTLNKKRPNGSTIRIGYVSPDFCKHPAAAFLEPVIAHHDRSRFEVFCYYHRTYNDERTQKFRTLADTWWDITHLNDSEVAEVIERDSIDILVDCAGHMAGNRLGVFARRPARLQISGFGYPSTTGLSAIDYRISDYCTDPVEKQIPEGEKLLRIDQGFFCYMPPDNAPDVCQPPCVTNRFVTFGSLHTTARLNKEVIKLWADVLNRVERSRLLLFRTTLTQSIIHRLSQWFSDEGVDLKRIDFKNCISPQGHLSTYNTIDCLLDTFPWSGHTTACESLWMGVPVITLRGERHAGRMVSSLLEQVGLTEFIAGSKLDYVDIAQKTAGNNKKLVTLRSSLRQQMLNSSVCDAKSWVQSFEDELEKILKNAYNILGLRSGK